MIKTKVFQLVGVKPILQQLAATKMPARDSFSVLRVLKLVDKEYETIETTQRELLNRYASKNEDGSFVTDKDGGIIIAKEHVEEFSKEMEELSNTDIELNCDKLKLETFNNLELSPNQLLAIEDFVDME